MHGVTRFVRFTSLPPLLPLEFSVQSVQEFQERLETYDVPDATLIATTAWASGRATPAARYQIIECGVPTGRRVRCLVCQTMVPEVRMGSAIQAWCSCTPAHDSGDRT